MCDNVGDHLMGNVYARYEWEAEAQKAVDSLNDRWYGGECGGLRRSPDIRKADDSFQADRFMPNCPQ